MSDSTRSTNDSRKTSSSTSSRDPSPSPSPIHGSSNSVEPTIQPALASPQVASTSSSTKTNQVDPTQLAMLQLIQSLTNQVNNMSMNQVSAQPSVASRNSNFHKLQLFYIDTRTIETVKCPKLEKMDPISFIEWKNQVEQWATGKANELLMITKSLNERQLNFAMV